VSGNSGVVRIGLTCAAIVVGAALVGSMLSTSTFSPPTIGAAAEEPASATEDDARATEDDASVPAEDSDSENVDYAESADENEGEPASQEHVVPQ